MPSYGYPRDTTPTLERLARSGAVFEDVTAQFAWTVPSMVSLFSGRYVTDWREVLPASDPCLAESFQRAGYRTLAGVANQLLDEQTGLRGFDTYDVRPSRIDARKTDPERSRDLAELFSDLEAELGALAADPARPPLFLYLHAYEPHDPYHARPRFEDELPVDAAVPAWPSDWHRAQYGRAADEERTRERDNEAAHFEALARYRGQYDHELRYLDEQLAAVLARMAELGLLDNCVLALASDHGEGLWDHCSPVSSFESSPESSTAEPEAARGPGEFFYGEHGATLHQEVVATPLILWGSGVPPGTRVSGAVENVDLFPTLLELAGLEPPAELDGRSLVPLLAGRGEGRELVFAYASDGRAMIRQVGTGLKLVLQEEQPVALFDLSADPLERVDRLAERADEAERLRAAFVAWRALHGTGEVSKDLLRDDAEELERLRRLGYTEIDIGR
jgi:arylsulfatase A-like enzyme